MLSGFFSALTSFSDQFEDLGSIKTCIFKRSKLAFLKDTSIPNLMYLASFDEKSREMDVQKYLRKISHSFLKKYNIKEIKNWSGRVDKFKSFEETIRKINEGENISQRKNHISINLEEIKKKNDPKYYDLVPFFKVTKKINPENYLISEISQKVFNNINNKNSIAQIAVDLGETPEKVHNICKNLIKMGFISLK